MIVAALLHWTVVRSRRVWAHSMSDASRDAQDMPDAQDAPQAIKTRRPPLATLAARIAHQRISVLCDRDNGVKITSLGA
jgi:hypothetical protein